MAEIAVLRTHIINYAKTRDTYVAYRKAGYSKKFREEHEEEILLHQAAKNAFDDMGVKKLPKVKELQAEYARLLEEKKKTYTEYRRSREEMRELLAAKANVDRLLNMETEHDTEKEDVYKRQTICSARWKSLTRTASWSARQICSPNGPSSPIRRWLWWIRLVKHWRCPSRKRPA